MKIRIINGVPVNVDFTGLRIINGTPILGRPAKTIVHERRGSTRGVSRGICKGT